MYLPADASATKARTTRYFMFKAWNDHCTAHLWQNNMKIWAKRGWAKYSRGERVTQAKDNDISVKILEHCPIPQQQLMNS